MTIESAPSHRLKQYGVAMANAELTNVDLPSVYYIMYTLGRLASDYKRGIHPLASAALHQADDILCHMTNCLPKPVEPGSGT